MFIESEYSKRLRSRYSVREGTWRSWHVAEKSKVATEAQSHRAANESESMENADKFWFSMFSPFSVSQFLSGKS
jgi:hypothetical protein